MVPARSALPVAGPYGRTLRWHPGDVVDCLRRTGRPRSANQAEPQANSN